VLCGTRLWLRVIDTLASMSSIPLTIPYRKVPCPRAIKILAPSLLDAVRDRPSVNSFFSQFWSFAVLG
jgi:hypothetical protein